MLRQSSASNALAAVSKKADFSQTSLKVVSLLLRK